MIRKLIANWQLTRQLSKRKAYRLQHSQATKQGLARIKRKPLCPDPAATQALFDRLDARRAA